MYYSVNIGRTQAAILLFYLFGFTSINAQIEHIPISNGVSVDRFYAGLLANTALSEDVINGNRPSSIQVGLRLSHWLIEKKVKIRTFGATQIKEGSNSSFIKSYELIFQHTKKVIFSIGVMATPTTELRPNPTTWQSQVETNAESNILGGKPGMKINYTFEDNLQIAYGIHLHAKQAAHHLKVRYKNLSVSNYLENNRLFTAARWDHKKLELVFNKFNEFVAHSAIINISDEYKCYLDIEFNSSIGTLTFGEWGLRKYFTNKKMISGFLAVSYNNQFKNFQGGLFIHI